MAAFLDDTIVSSTVQNKWISFLDKHGVIFKNTFCPRKSVFSDKIANDGSSVLAAGFFFDGATYDIVIQEILQASFHECVRVYQGTNSGIQLT